MRTSALLVICWFISSFCIAQQDSARLDTSALEDIKDNILDDLPNISLDENDFSEANSQNISSLLTAGRDPFFSAAIFNFSPVRFRIRGYSADLSSTFMNGIP